MPEYTCPHCKNPIYDDEALLCHFCGESLRRNVGVMGKMKYAMPGLLIFFAIILVLLILIVWLRS